MIPKIQIDRSIQRVSWIHDPAHGAVPEGAQPEFRTEIPEGADVFEFRPLSFRELSVIDAYGAGRVHLALETALVGASISGESFKGPDALRAVTETLPPAVGIALGRHILTVSGGDTEARRFR